MHHSLDRAERNCKALSLKAALLPLLSLIGCALSPAANATATCGVKSRSEGIVVVVCPASATPKAMRDAGVAACQGLKPCNAWIWDDAAKAPAKAPGSESDLSKGEVRDARAVWMNDSQNLMMLEKVK